MPYLVTSAHVVLLHRKHSPPGKPVEVRLGGRLCMELTGVEPVSEKKSVRVSPGAVCLLNFPWRGRTHTRYALVAS